MTFTRKSFQNWNVGEEALPCSRKIWMSVVNLPEMTSVSCGMTSATGTSSVSADSRSLTSDRMGWFISWHHILNCRMNRLFKASSTSRRPRSARSKSLPDIICWTLTAAYTPDSCRSCFKPAGGGVRNVIFLRTPSFPKVSSLVFINSYSRWSIIATLENVVLPSQVPQKIKLFSGPCCSTNNTDRHTTLATTPFFVSVS